tara:strand:+ start:834 stop:1196 length:363 start_codon:yes stop_codon:yes gene_type:complete
MSYLKPQLHEGTYVFTSVSLDTPISELNVVASVRESEGLTLVLSEQEASQRGFDIHFRCRWITLTVHTALDSEGLTALFSHALARESIACNVIAGTHHDHIFVPKEKAEKALQCLMKIQP